MNIPYNEYQKIVRRQVDDLSKAQAGDRDAYNRVGVLIMDIICAKLKMKRFRGYTQDVKNQFYDSAVYWTLFHVKDWKPGKASPYGFFCMIVEQAFFGVLRTMKPHGFSLKDPLIFSQHGYSPYGVKLTDNEKRYC